jgi:DNA invertase Pin-like site-specific DNA recombinase
VSSSQPIQAAIYVRMSTESQNYSTDHQRAKIHEYALSKRILSCTRVRGRGQEWTRH